MRSPALSARAQIHFARFLNLPSTRLPSFLLVGTGTRADSGDAGTEAVTCDYCRTTAAAVYCRADAARLCLPCDRIVHGTNSVCSCHACAPLCTDCRAAGAVFRSDRSQWLSPSTVVLPQRRRPSVRRGC